MSYTSGPTWCGQERVKHSFPFCVGRGSGDQPSCERGQSGGCVLSVLKEPHGMMQDPPPSPSPDCSGGLA